MQPETGVRETYRIDGVYQITKDDYVSGKRFEDAVSYSFYPIDLHDKEGIVPKQNKVYVSTKTYLYCNFETVKGTLSKNNSNEYETSFVYFHSYSRSKCWSM
jgi:hypothetical protein